MIIKVCGIQIIENLKHLVFLDIDMIGFIFYPKSKRYVEQKGVDFEVLQQIKVNHYGIDKVGVFVDNDEAYILKKVNDYGLDMVQLHGSESFSLCDALQKKNIKVIKAFSIGDDFNFRNLAPYTFSCDYFLFDTKGKQPGGNGITFNWNLLNNYQETTPFILSGGIGPEALSELKKFKHPQWAGIDLNSKFEDSPGLKNIDKLKIFINELRIDQPTFWKN